MSANFLDIGALQSRGLDIGPLQSSGTLSTAASPSVSTWVSPTAATRASVAASPSIASWVSPTAGTKASVSGSPSVASWVVPNATIRIPRILPTVSVSRTVYANIPASRTVYDPIEVS